MGREVIFSWTSLAGDELDFYNDGTYGIGDGDMVMETGRWRYENGQFEVMEDGTNYWENVDKAEHEVRNAIDRFIDQLVAADLEKAIWDEK